MFAAMIPATVNVFLALSLDGFIARPDHGLDWLDAFGDPTGNEDYGFADFLQRMDALVMGRNTYDVVAGFPDWPYGDKRVVVLTSRDLQSPLPTVKAASGSLSAVVSRLASEGVREIYLDGGATITQGLTEGLVRHLILNWIPISLGSGIPLFGKGLNESHWRLVSVRGYDSGLVQTHHEWLD
jgi:dihydrofolate reductase